MNKPNRIVFLEKGDRNEENKGIVIKDYLIDSL